MKRFFFIFCMILGTSYFAKANDADLFNYDKGSIDLLMTNLTVADNYLNDNPDVNMSELLSLGKIAVNGVNYSMGFLAFNAEPPLGIPSFIWGCAFGWVGLLVVYLATDKDKEQTHKALIGCAVGTGLEVVVWVIYYAVVVKAATSGI